MSQLKIALGRTTTQTAVAPVDQDFTVASADFTPKASMMFMSNGQTNKVWQGHIRYSIGFTDGTNTRSIHARAKDGSTTTSLCHSTASTSHILNFLNTGGTAMAGSMTFKEFIAPSAGANGGVRGTWDNELNNPFHMMHAHFGGASIQAKVGDFTTSATVGSTKAVTGLGGTPDVIFFASCSSSDWLETVDADAHLSIGWACRKLDGTKLQRAIAWGTENGQSTSNNGTSFLDNRCCGDVALSSGATQGSGAQLSSFDSDGFTVKTQDATGGQRIMFLALWDPGSQIEAWSGDFTSETATGNKAYTNPGWEPQAYFDIATLLTSTGVFNSAGNSETISFGMASNDGAWAHSIRQDQGVTTTDCDSMAMTQVSLNHFGGTATGGVTKDHVSMDETGWTENFTQVLATGRRFATLAFREPGIEHMLRRYEGSPAPNTLTRM